MVSLIVAVGNNYEIGNRGELLWRLPQDLKNFKRITMGHHLIMGRKTFESIGRPLPGRTTVIITRQKDYKIEGCEVVHSLEEALEVARNNGDDEAMVVGGGEIYKEALPHTDKIYFSQVQYDGEADTYFPKLDLSTWESSNKVKYEKTEKTLPWTFETLTKK